MAKAVALRDVERHSLQQAELKLLENWYSSSSCLFGVKMAVL